MTKTQTIINWIATNYSTWELTTDIIWRIAEETSAAVSTVYRAIRQLETQGAMTGKRYTGRQFVQPAELVNYASEGQLLVTTAKADKIASDLHATQSAVYAGLRYGVMTGQLIERNGGFYGLLYEVK